MVPSVREPLVPYGARNDILAGMPHHHGVLHTWFQRVTQTDAQIIMGDLNRGNQAGV